MLIVVLLIICFQLIFCFSSEQFLAKTRIEWKSVYENQDFDADSFPIFHLLSPPTGPPFCQPCICFYKDIKFSTRTKVLEERKKWREKDTIEFNKYLRIDFISKSEPTSFFQERLKFRTRSLVSFEDQSSKSLLISKPNFYK